MGLVEDLETVSQAQELRPYELDPKNRPEPAPKLLECDGVPFVQVGDITVITGQAKNGKTTLSVLLIASVLGYTDFFTPTKQNASVLYFDTEQSDDDCLIVSDYVHKLMGWDIYERNPRFRYYRYRCAEKMGEDGTPEPLKPCEILDRIEQEIMLLPPDAIVLDGCTDLMDDINDIGESVRIVRKLLALCSKYQFALITIVHQNQGGASDEPRGHVGRELVRKCNAVLSVTKHKQGDDLYFTVSNKESRHLPIKDWSFRRDKDGTPYPFDAPSPTEEKERKKREELQLAFAEVFRDRRPRLNTELKNDLMRVCNIAIATANRRIKDAIESGVIICEGGKYSLPPPHETE